MSFEDKATNEACLIDFPRERSSALFVRGYVLDKNISLLLLESLPLRR